MNTSANLLTCSNNLYKAYLLTTYKTLISGLNYAFMNIITNMNPICAELSFCAKNDERTKCSRN